MDIDRARITADGNAHHPVERPVPSAFAWTAAGVALSATALLSSVALPAPLVLLALGSVLALAGFALAGGLYLAGRRIGRDGAAGWDTAAALVFFGFAAALLTDTGEAMTAFAEMRGR
jgi:hypothetical protein